MKAATISISCNICAKAELFIAALQPQIAATYIFVIAVPVYEILGAALNVGVIHSVDGLLPIYTRLPAKLDAHWAGT